MKASRGLYQAAIFTCIFLTTAATSAQQPLPTSEARDFAVLYGLHRDGHDQLAFDEIQRFLKKYPSSPQREEVFFLSAECLRNMKQFNQAAQVYESFVREYPASTRAAECQFRLAELSYASGRYAEAAERFAFFVQRPPSEEIAAAASYWLAETVYREGDEREAARLYEESVDRYPSGMYADYALFSVAWLAGRSGDQGKAANAYRALAEKYPFSPLVLSARVGLAESHYRQKEYRRAIEELEVVRPQLASDPDVLARAEFLLGHCYLQMEDGGRARTQFETLAGGEAALQYGREAEYALALLSLKERKYTDALRRFDALSRGSDSVATASLFQKGVTLRLSGDETEAVATLEGMTSAEPADTYADNALYELALIRYDKGDYAGALRYLGRVLQERPGSDRLGETYWMMGECYRAQHQLEKAREAYRAASRSPGTPERVIAEALLEEGWVLYRLGRYNEAAERLNQVTASAAGLERKDEAHFWLAESYYQAKRFRDALAEYTIVVTRFPKSPRFFDALFGKAWARYSLGEYADAATDFQELLSRRPDGPHVVDARLRLADSYYLSKDYGRAASAYAASLRASKGREGIDYLRFQLGQCYLRSGDPEKGLRQLEELLTQDPASAYCDDAQYAIGWYFFQAKEYQKAVVEFKELVSRYPGSDLIPKTLYAVGDAYYNLNEYPKAILSYREVLE